MAVNKSAGDGSASSRHQVVECERERNAGTTRMEFRANGLRENPKGEYNDRSRVEEQAEGSRQGDPPTVKDSGAHALNTHSESPKNPNHGKVREDPCFSRDDSPDALPACVRLSEAANVEVDHIPGTMCSQRHSRE